MLRQCLQCDTWFSPARWDQIWCSTSCRAAGWRSGLKPRAPTSRPASNGDADGPAGDLIFPSDNEYEIPALRLDLQADAIDLPFTQWGSVRRAATMPGTWHFYTDDFRFASLWDHPERVAATKCVTCIEINYSTTNETETARLIWQTYRKRWIARYWQTRGIRIIVDLNVASKAAEINMLGVPKGWRSFATRGYDAIPGALALEYRIACSIADPGVPLFVVYGGGAQIHELCRANAWLHIPDEIGLRNG